MLVSGNPYGRDEVLKLDNFVSGELVEEKAAKCILTFVEDGREQYRSFRKEHFVEKLLKCSASITKVNPPKFKPYHNNQNSLKLKLWRKN